MKNSVIFGWKIRESFKNLYGIDVRIVYSSFEVHFPLKCCTILPLLANVLYKFQWPYDEYKVYIGKTQRHFATRVKAHPKGVSAIHDHVFLCVSCQSNYSVSLFRVTDTTRNDFGTTMKESLHIKNSKPSINKQLLNTGSSFISMLFDNTMFV